MITFSSSVDVEHLDLLVHKSPWGEIPGDWLNSMSWYSWPCWHFLFHTFWSFLVLTDSDWLADQDSTVLFIMNKWILLKKGYLQYQQWAISGFGLTASPTRVSRSRCRHLVPVFNHNNKENESAGKGSGPHWLTKDNGQHFTETTQTIHSRIVPSFRLWVKTEHFF